MKPYQTMSDDFSDQSEQSLDTSSENSKKNVDLHFYRVHLIYPTHFTKLDKWKNYCEKHFNNSTVFEDFISADELEDNDHPHKHNHTGLSYGNNQKHIRTTRYFDIINPKTGEVIHPSIKIVKYRKQWLQLKLYINGHKADKCIRNKYHFVPPINFYGDKLEPCDIIDKKLQIHDDFENPNFDLKELKRKYIDIEIKNPHFYYSMLNKRMKHEAIKKYDEGYLKVTWVYGHPRQGKTQYIQSLAREKAKEYNETPCVVRSTQNQFQFFGDYHYHKVMIIDDIDESWFKYPLLKTVIDYLYHEIQVKGFEKWNLVTDFYITSIHHPNTMYPNHDRTELLGRITTLINFDELHKEPICNPSIDVSDEAMKYYKKYFKTYTKEFEQFINEIMYLGYLNNIPWIPKNIIIIK